MVVCVGTSYAQETQIQFPFLNFHMEMNNNLQPSVSYNIQSEIVVGDQSGLVFGMGVIGDNIQNFQGTISDLIQLDNLRMSIRPFPIFTGTVFYGRYAYIGQDKVVPRGMQFFQTPGVAYYGYRTIRGAGIAAAFPIQGGRYEPQVLIYSDNFQGVTYFNTEFMTILRLEKLYIDLYLGITSPASAGTATAQNQNIGFRAGFSLTTAIEPMNFYIALYIPSHFGTQFEFDDIYFRLSGFLAYRGFEMAISLMSLDSEADDSTNPFVGFNGSPDLNFFLSLGGRIRRVGFGFDYTYIYGLFQQSIAINLLDSHSNRLGIYVDYKFFELTYKLGVFYTLPGSPAFTSTVSQPGDFGFYISVYGDL
ncbi:MAG: hypothetical protein ACRCY4_02615 [Brevinema sp.]